MDALAESIITTLHEPLLVLAPDLRVESVNPAFYRYFKVQPAETLGRRIYDLGNRQWNIPRLRELLEEVLPQNNVIEGYEVSHSFENIGDRVMLLNARKLEGNGLILLGLRDITEPKRIEHNLLNKVQRTTEALGSTQEELRALSVRLITAQEEERRRIARELHDDFAQRTALMDLELERLIPLLLPTAGAADALSSVRENLAKLSADLREISHALHPAVISDLGLVASLRQLVRELNDAGGNARFVSRSQASLTVEQTTNLYRIAQEALRNAMKHAPGAFVRVTLVVTDRQFRLLVADSGPGFNLDDVRDGRGLGLLSMQERARMAGGKMAVRTKPGGGCRSASRFLALHERENPSARSHGLR